MVWSCLLFIRSGQNLLTRHSERGKKTRRTKEEVGRQHQGMDRPGVRQVPEGSGEQGKMEETGCKIICVAPTTLAVKRLMMTTMMTTTTTMMKRKDRKTISAESSLVFFRRPMGQVTEQNMRLNHRAYKVYALWIQLKTHTLAQPGGRKKCCGDVTKWCNQYVLLLQRFSLPSPP